MKCLFDKERKPIECHKTKQAGRGQQAMHHKEAIKVIRSNWPDERYTMLREALELAIEALEAVGEEGRNKEQFGLGLSRTCTIGRTKKA